MAYCLTNFVITLAYILNVTLGFTTFQDLALFVLIYYYLGK